MTARYAAWGWLRLEPFIARSSVLDWRESRVSQKAQARTSAPRSKSGWRTAEASGLIWCAECFTLWARNGKFPACLVTPTWNDLDLADWRFTNSFGCPTFVNGGRDYEANHDGFVYTLSPDVEDAYSLADRFVLARVPASQIRERNAYEFFAGRARDGSPAWTSKLQERASVLTRPGACYRPSVTFHPLLNRYLLVHPRPNDRSRDSSGKIDVRFHGGLAIYESPQPWGPWSVVFDTDAWDVGPGDSASFPAKWISADGRTLHLFSGNDSFQDKCS
jgi:hypothetical protein